MAPIQGPEKQGVVEMRTLVAKLNRKFELPAPVKQKAKDGSGDVIAVSHRLGKEGGFLTKLDLFTLFGFERQYAEFCAKERRSFGDRDNFDFVTKQIKKELYSRVTRIVTEHRRHLEQFYQNYPRPLLPMYAFVQVGDKTEGLYLQGLQDQETLKPVVFGEQVDVELWLQKTYLSTRSAADMNQRAKKTARAAMGLPGVNKDVLFRLKQIADGQVPDKLLLLAPDGESK